MDIHKIGYHVKLLFTYDPTNQTFLSQGGNLAPAKLVGKLLNSLWGMPPPAPHSTTGNPQVNEYQHQQQEAAKLSYSQSANTMSSLMPPASIEPVHEWGGNGRTMAAHSRSVSEPDFSRTPIQVYITRKPFLFLLFC